MCLLPWGNRLKFYLTVSPVPGKYNVMNIEYIYRVHIYIYIKLLNSTIDSV